MRPIILAGHERPVTQVIYNREGDLLFTAARDRSPMVWRAQQGGARLGTFEGHGGAIISIDVTADSKYLITGSADNSARMWEVNGGKQVFQWDFKCPVSSVSISPDEKHVAFATSMLMKQEPEIHIMKFSHDPSTLEVEKVQSLKGPKVTMSRALWTGAGEHIICGAEDGTVRKFDVKSGEEIACVREHAGAINDLQIAPNKVHFITASADKTAKLWDLEDMSILKTFKTERPVNSAAISPLMDHIVLGGGQDASQVTTTTTQERFDSRFYHKIYETEIGKVGGHFGPINAVAFSPDGKQYTSGGEESVVRMHNLDEEYFTRNYN